ncbi:ATP-binding protein [Desertifilum tharense IPPAS B-1220]|uniref:ATP-binding protein n=1 Tax=Desertifilum tharense TaxID=1185873 RepID=UPI00090406DC|nr:ATP-binding protein [Desertifilum tharense]
MQRFIYPSAPTYLVLIYLVLFLVLSYLTQFWDSLTGQTLWYVPMGLSLALLIRYGWHYLPLVLLGRWLSDFWLVPLPLPAWVIFSLSGIYAGGYGLAAHLLRRFLHPLSQIGYLRGTSLFVLVVLGLVSAIASAGTTLLSLADAIPDFAPFSSGLNWLRSELIGTLAIAPFFLVNAVHWIKVIKRSLQTAEWKNFNRFSWQSGAVLVFQISTLFFLPLAIVRLKFVGEIHLLYFCFLPLIWICLQRGFAGATAGAIAIATSLTIGLNLINQNPTELTDFQIFMMALTLTSLFTGAAVSENFRVQEALRASEEQFRQFAENIPQVFRMTSLNGRQLIYVSPAYQDIWGRSCQSLYESPQSWIEAIHPQDRPIVLAAIEQHKKGKSTSEEYRILRPDGSTRWIWSRTFPIHNAQGKVYRLATLAQDVSKQKQVEEEAFNAMAKEKELSELRTRIITTTSHEFRTPLTTIFSSAELLEYYSQRWTEAEKLEHLRQIQESVHHMTQLLDDLLLIGQAEAQRLEFTPVALDLVKFCQEMVSQMQVVALPGQKIIFTHQALSLQAEVDPKLLRHILANLLINAIHYSAPKKSIYLKLSIHKDEILFKIKDSGIGIPPEDQLFIFKSFHRGKNVGNIAGTGLGLTVVKKCVSLHQGRVTFQSEVGVGTTFIVRIPQCQKERAIAYNQSPSSPS